MTAHGMNLTRLGLGANAGFSLAMGALLAVAPSTVGGRLGVDIDLWLRLFGIALVVHGAVLAWVVRQPRLETWTKLNLAIIAPYPLLMIGVVVGGLVDQGQALVLIDGAFIGAFALLQWSGVRKVKSMPQPRQA